jgi:hypothetical protein
MSPYVSSWTVAARCVRSGPRPQTLTERLRRYSARCGHGGVLVREDADGVEKRSTLDATTQLAALLISAPLMVVLLGPRGTHTA